MKVKKIQTDRAPGAIGPYSQAIDVNGLVFLSGQIPLDPSTGKLVEGGIVEQTTQVMRNIGEILEAGGMTYADVVRAEVYLADIADFAAVNEIYAQYFNAEPRPARHAVQVAGLPLNALIEITCTALNSWPEGQ